MISNIYDKYIPFMNIVQFAHIHSHMQSTIGFISSSDALQIIVIFIHCVCVCVYNATNIVKPWRIKLSELNINKLYYSLVLLA